MCMYTMDPWLLSHDTTIRAPDPGFQPCKASLPPARTMLARQATKLGRDQADMLDLHSDLGVKDAATIYVTLATIHHLKGRGHAILARRKFEADPWWRKANWQFSEINAAGGSMPKPAKSLLLPQVPTCNSSKSNHCAADFARAGESRL